MQGKGIPMARPRHENRSGRRALISWRLALAAGASLWGGTMGAPPSVADATDEPARPSASAGTGSDAPEARGGQPARSRAPRLSGLTWLRGSAGSTGSDHWGAGTACLAVVLAMGVGVGL